MQKDVVLSKRDAPWLRYFGDAEPADMGDSMSISGVGPEFVRKQVERLNIELAMRRPRRAIAVFFDTDIHTYPSMDLQFAMVEKYVKANSSMLMWDGEVDSVVQVIEPMKLRTNVRRLGFTDFVFHYAHDHTHIIFPTISFVTDSDEYTRVPLAGIAKGKTVAILDHAIDTWRFPEQIQAFAASARGTKATPIAHLIANSQYKKLRNETGIGWYRNRNAVVPDMKFRDICKTLTALIDNGTLEYDQHDDAARKAYYDILKRLFPTKFFDSTHCKTDHVSAYYMAKKLGFPKSLTLHVARVIIKHHHMDIMKRGVAAFNEQAAREFVKQLSDDDSQAKVELSKVAAYQIAARLWKVAQSPYEPATFEPWVTQAMQEVPQIHEVDQRLSRKLQASAVYKAAIDILQASGVHISKNGFVVNQIMNAIERIKERRRYPPKTTFSQSGNEKFKLHGVLAQVTRQDAQMESERSKARKSAKRRLKERRRQKWLMKIGREQAKQMRKADERARQKAEELGKLVDAARSSDESGPAGDLAMSGQFDDQQPGGDGASIVDRE